MKRVNILTTRLERWLLNAQFRAFLMKYMYYAMLLVLALLIGYLSGLNQRSVPKGELSIGINEEIQRMTQNIKKEEGIGKSSKEYGQYFGSINGTKYYPLECTKSNRIKAENRIWFQNEEEAEREGYQSSKGC